MQPKIIKMEKRYITGLFGNIDNQGEIWKKIKKFYAKKPFAKFAKYDCHIYLWDMRDKEKTVFFGYETEGAIDSDDFVTIEIPACEWAIFEVKPAKWWKSGDKEVESWIADNEKYNWRTYEGSIFQFEYYKEQFKGGKNPDSRMEVWYPLENKS